MCQWRHSWWLKILQRAWCSDFPLCCLSREVMLFDPVFLTALLFFLTFIPYPTVSSSASGTSFMGCWGLEFTWKHWHFIKIQRRKRQETLVNPSQLSWCHTSPLSLFPQSFFQSVSQGPLFPIVLLAPTKIPRMGQDGKLSIIYYGRF